MFQPLCFNQIITDLYNYKAGFMKFQAIEYTQESEHASSCENFASKSGQALIKFLQAI